MSRRLLRTRRHTDATPIEHHDKNMRAGAGSTACALLLAPPAGAAKRQWQRRGRGLEVAGADVDTLNSIM
jgi:hypothetical protein